MRTVSRILIVGTLGILATVAPCISRAETLVSKEAPAGTLGLSVRNELNAAVGRGQNWIVSMQKDDGSWSQGSFPALTALSTWALLDSDQPACRKAVDKGIEYILSCVQKDGGIYKNVPGRKGGGLSNYNTAICMTVLNEAKRRDLVPVILKAREFVASSQHMGDDLYRGGFGYDKQTGRAYTDLLNTYYAVQAMNMTAGVEDLRPKTSKKVDVDWDATIKFIERMQNKEGTDENAGGFFYNPTDPKAGSTTNAAGIVTFRSYGSMTYAGLLSLIYSEVPRTDHRVRSAFDWSSNHWSLKENPGMGAQGLYFFYNVLTRSLSAYGQDLLPAKNGKLVDWRAEIAKKLISIQKIDPKTGNGYWQNETGRFWENDPTLSTAYSVIALKML